MPSRTRSLRTGVLLAAGSVLFTALALAAIGEWAVRYRERNRTTVPGTMSKLYYRHARLDHAFTRGAQYYRWVNIGRQGFRGGRDVSMAPADSVYRIIAVGGSTTFDGNTSGDSSSWPARLEQILDSIAAPRQFEVLNAGVPGYRVFDDLVRLEYELYLFQPDLVIMYQGHNDLFNTLSDGLRARRREFEPTPGEIPTVYPGQRWLERNSLLYHKLRSRLRAIRFRSSGSVQREQTPGPRYDKIIRSGTEHFALNLRMYLAVARSLGIEVIVPQLVYAGASPPGSDPGAAVDRWDRGFVLAPTDIVWHGYALYDSTARAAATEFGARHVPVSDSTLWWLDGYASGDPIHFNDAGAQRFAAHLAAAIQPLAQLRGVVADGAHHVQGTWPVAAGAGGRD